MKEISSKTWNWIIAAGALVFVVGTWLWVRTGLPSVGADPAQWTIAGTAGDAFGALNALFSGLAFAGFLLALKMQRDELAEQRRENVAAREEAERHTAATERMRRASLLGVMAQINTTLGKSNEYGEKEIAELRWVLERVQKELEWEPAPDERVAAEMKSRFSFSVR